MYIMQSYSQELFWQNSNNSQPWVINYGKKGPLTRAGSITQKLFQDQFW